MAPFEGRHQKSAMATIALMALMGIFAQKKAASGWEAT